MKIARKWVTVTDRRALLCKLAFMLHINKVNRLNSANSARRSVTVTRFRAIFMYTPIFLCFQELKGPKNTKISAYNFWKVGKVNFWPL